MVTTQLSKQDLDFLQSRGIDPALLDGYRHALIQGYPWMQLAGNCTAGKEILTFDDSERERLRGVYRQASGMKVLKFVPASGAASRMFKELFTFAESGKTTEPVETFFARLHHYPFYEALMQKWSEANLGGAGDQRRSMIRLLLLAEGLNYGQLPKGLILFHRYPDGHTRTAFEEHFHEAVRYAMKGDAAYLHFTIPDTTRNEVLAHLAALKQRLQAHFGVQFEVETSVQKPSTDTPAIYAADHSWVRDEEGMLLLRPAGHGALLDNLNELDADLVFVKNIDNVVPDDRKETTVAFKELLAGILIEVQAEAHRFLRDLETGQLDRATCAAFFAKWYHTDISGMSDTSIAALLNRPIRVCGMVKNEGEPGGGPFLVHEPNNSLSMQIVEKSQVDANDPAQRTLLDSATHFNPVDLVLGLKDYTGARFDLHRYRNPDTGMVVHKTHMGRDIKALELPGLWNGSMHHWNTLFVEVPIDTFNPVKTVFDLLRPAHVSH
jgi:hypothetical protein